MLEGMGKERGGGGGRLLYFPAYFTTSPLMEKWHDVFEPLRTSVNRIVSFFKAGRGDSWVFCLFACLLLCLCVRACACVEKKKSSLY